MNVHLGPVAIVDADESANLANALALCAKVLRRDGVAVPAWLIDLEVRFRRLSDAKQAAKPTTCDVDEDVDAGGFDGGQSPVMTTTDAGRWLRMTPQAVGKHLAAGSLTGRKIRGSWQVDLDSVERLAAERGGGA